VSFKWYQQRDTALILFVLGRIFMVAEYIKFENTGQQEASLLFSCPTKWSL